MEAAADTELFGTLRLVRGGKHGYAGVRGGQGKKRDKFQAYCTIDRKKMTDVHALVTDMCETGRFGQRLPKVVGNPLAQIVALCAQGSACPHVYPAGRPFSAWCVWLM